MSQYLNPHGLMRIGQVITWHYVEAPAGVSLEATLKPTFWQHVSAKLRPRDRIMVDAEDGTWTANLLVIDSGTTYARVKVLEQYDLSEATEISEVPATESEPFRVAFGGRAKWRVIRNEDNKVLVENLQTKDDAVKWALENRRTYAA